MKRIKVLNFSLFLLLICTLLTSCAHRQPLHATASAVAAFRQELETIFSDPSFANAHWGVAVQSLKTGEFFYLRNENKEFMPASNMKIFTTAVAMFKLGADFHFVTKVYTNGLVRPDGVLEGDVIIRGCGDPSLGGRFNGGKMTLVFEQWADSLQAKGVKSISGRMIGDDNYFVDEPLGTGWSWDYLNDYYAAQVSALSFNDNCIDILFSPGDSVGAAASFRLEPCTRYVEIINQVKTGSRTNLSFDRAPGSNRIVCRGTIGIKDSTRRDWVTIDNPTKYTAQVFMDILAARGIKTQGGCHDIDDLADFTYAPLEIYSLCSNSSPALKDIVTVVNKESVNLYAELLFRVNAKELTGIGSTENAEQAEKVIFGAMGINPEHLTLADGSGLTRLDLITPMSTVKLLNYMRRQACGQDFMNTLPIAGVDGTLKGRMRQTMAEGKIRAKTGMIAKVRALSGYAATQDGEELAFSMIVNFYNGPTGMANQIQDLVCERMAAFKR